MLMVKNQFQICFHETWKVSHSGKGESPKLLTYGACSFEVGVPLKFSGNEYGTDFMLSSSSLKSEGAATYFCQQYDDLPPTVLQTKTKILKERQLLVGISICSSVYCNDTQVKP